MSEAQKKEAERLQKLVDEHQFTNSYEDRDCVVCGKPKKEHGQMDSTSRERATQGGVHLDPPESSAIIVAPTQTTKK